MELSSSGDVQKTLYDCGRGAPHSFFVRLSHLTARVALFRSVFFSARFSSSSVKLSASEVIFTTYCRKIGEQK